MMPDTEIHSYDYDEDKIKLAKHCFAVAPNHIYELGDIINTEYVDSDIFIINDVLHYMTADERKTVLEKCLSKLKPGGKIIVRDADKSELKTHKLTKLTEWFSTSTVISFNKVARDIDFFDAEEMVSFAQKNGLEISITANDEKTSNKIFFLKR